jgi:hypothetical protein
VSSLLYTHSSFYLRHSRRLYLGTLLPLESEYTRLRLYLGSPSNNFIQSVSFELTVFARRLSMAFSGRVCILPTSRFRLAVPSVSRVKTSNIPFSMVSMLVSSDDDYLEDGQVEERYNGGEHVNFPRSHRTH